MPSGTLLLIDDETSLRQLLARVLELEGYAVLQAPDASRGLELLRQHAAEVLVLLSDVKLPDGYGLDLLPRYKQAAPLAEVILMTAYGTIPDGVRAMKDGAFDYLTKGDSDDQLLVVVERAAEKARLQQRVADLEKKIGAQYSFESMIGHSAALAQAKKLAQRVAPTDSTVLLEGPTGAGKELFAQAIHHASARQHKPFVALNCSAFPKDLLESELFGYKKGAFTGALADKKGLLEEATGGTLFLDEIGELELNVQAKFLRVLETRQFTKLGDTKPTSVNLRIVAATNRNLKLEAASHHFRPDLYYRLSVFTVLVPGLNERREDIAPLADYFLQYFAARLRKRLRGLEPEALHQLQRYDWRGNVRELKNVLERAAILADSDLLTVDDLPAEFHYLSATPATDAASDRSLRTLEKQQIRQVLHETGGNKMEAARQLGIGTKTLYRKIQEYGL
ncbi:sigma-54-dependent transcriptional regulator [Hymenobacter mucosus]|uniref:DNA-binding transcriptional response regulator, NtrC family, contains REC, AAA-type ATPase, and a Fis-type DNA-binding domains n=2 Tax=Hymenobacter TaxID=89966 RepID=A0A238V5J1_9BACT|nr:sigma-54 dependent transcriptional regulator [Hymenobacter mucosus]SNR29745.1 DNA-binding transcriptional response regulator, NtrC family, contains REC, AAA-type ATPase, and a Fis-type DNA-binding domains [Hymenobacter mucosus]